MHEIHVSAVAAEPFLYDCSAVNLSQVSISTLKQLATNKAQHLFTLNALIPFLEVSDNQTCVTQRIRQLGADGCIADFRWQKGADFKGDARAGFYWPLSYA